MVELRNHNSNITYVLLLMKNYIYTTKLSEMIPVFCVFRNYLHKTINLEKTDCSDKKTSWKYFTICGDITFILEHMIFYS